MQLRPSVAVEDRYRPQKLAEKGLKIIHTTQLQAHTFEIGLAGEGTITRRFTLYARALAFFLCV